MSQAARAASPDADAQTPPQAPAGIARVWRRLRRNPLGLAGLVIAVGLVGVALLAPVLAPHSPFYQFPNGLLSDGAPVGFSREFPLGTDPLGRDLLSRLIWGTRTALEIGILANVVATTIGITFGALAGYYGGLTDAVLMRFTEVLLAIPTVLLAAFLALIARPSVESLILIIGCVSWYYLARIVRAEVMATRQLEFVEAARAAGASNPRILVRHVLAQVWGTVAVYMTLQFSTTTMFTAALSFVGIGVQPPAPDWGNLISDGSLYLTSVPRLMVIPGLVLGIAVLGFNLLGDALRDATSR